MTSSPDYRVFFLEDIAQLRQCMEIQKVTWGFADEDVLPLRALIVCTKIGGQVIGAVDGDGRVLGFLNAMPGYRDGQVYLHSHMMGVRPECQNRGIGKRLKLAQREDALARGIRQIEWTFDPLEIRNARFNIELLGVVCRRYLVNVYGVTSSRLHAGLPTDRLVAEWHLDSDRVKARTERERLTSNESSASSVQQAPPLEIPFNIGELRSTSPAQVLELQLAVRAKMLELFTRGFCVAGFAMDSHGQKAAYLFELCDGLIPTS